MEKSGSKNKKHTINEFDCLKRFSILDRATQCHTAVNTKFDVVIIGGGITGAGIALDAASRGLRTCLIEKNDFASGTSNKSTKLIHGGLRYLKSFEIALVKESGRERAIVHQLAPHLVVPEKMLLPLIVGGTYGKLMTSLGLKVYDLLANVTGDDRRKMLNKDQTTNKEPLLDGSKVLGGGFYSEYRTDDARLTIELLKKAASYGAVIFNYMECNSFNYNDKGKLKTLTCKDHITQKNIEVQSHSFVSAAGPWVDTLRKLDGSFTNKRLQLSKGVHLVFPYAKLPIQQALYFDVAGGRMLFAIPRGEVTYVGTTDTAYFGNLDRVVSTKADLHYILNGINAIFPTIDLKETDVISSWAGLRPLIHQDDKKSTEVSRRDEVFISKSGLISIAGGKLTGYRMMAIRVLEEVLKKVPKKRKKYIHKSNTLNIPLTSAPLRSSEEVKTYLEHIKNKLKTLGISTPYLANYAVLNYGKQTNVILENLSCFKDDTIKEALIRAELKYTIEYEMVHSLTDFFVRRTSRLYFEIDAIKKYQDIIVKDMANYFNWTPNIIASEVKALATLLKDATTFYDTEIDA